MNNCKKCGGAVRLRGHRITVNRKRGVYHYIEHVDGACDASKDFDAATMKTDKVKNYDLLVERWNTDNPQPPTL